MVEVRAGASMGAGWSRSKRRVSVATFNRSSSTSTPLPSCRDKRYAHLSAFIRISIYFILDNQQIVRTIFTHIMAQNQHSNLKSD